MRGKSAALASVSLSVFVLYAVKTMKKSMTALDEVNRTLAEVKLAALKATNEATGLIRTVNGTVKDVKGRINTVDPLLETTHEVGDVLHTIAHSVKEALSPGEKEGGTREADRRPKAAPALPQTGAAPADSQGITIRFGDQTGGEPGAGRPSLLRL